MTALCWHGYVPDVSPGSATAFACTGPGRPTQGHWCNPAKLLLDPYAKALDGAWNWNEAMFPYTFDDPDILEATISTARRSCPSRSSSTRSSTGAATAVRNTPWHRTVIYETHVKGFTQAPSGDSRGDCAARTPAWRIRRRSSTCSGSASPRSSCCRCTSSCRTRRCTSAGCATTGATTRSATSRRTTSILARPARRAGAGVQALVKTLHDAGIEVILDVVYNHTAEGNHLGPMLSFKGIDNAAYYRLVGRQPPVLHGLHRHRQHAEHAPPARAAADHGQPALLGARDARRRLPLRPRGDAGARAARRRSAVGVLRSDPAGSGRQPGQADRRAVGRRRRRLPGRQLSAAVVGVERQVPRLRARLLARHRSDAGRVRATGSPAARICTRAPRGEPHASINFITAHDGFTLRDLVSYNEKHNEANGEDNRDGESHNRSWNCGAEGPTDDPEVIALRARQQRNFLATLLLSQGVPMLLGGDEIGRTQRGNNNAYCQDNEISWYDWDDADKRCCSSRASLIRLRQRHPVFCRRRWFQGRPIRGTERQRHRLVHARRRRDVGAGLAGGLRQVARRVPERRRDPDAATSAASASSTTAST